jgi:glyoxylase-like metal-dependent hydrolase (beta-lactamase superfamily II)
MKIESRTVGPFQENSYLVTDERAQRAILIDPGDEPAVLIDLVEKSGATLEAIWLTHGHIDHIGGIHGVRRRWRVPVFMHPLDAPLFNRAADIAVMYGVPFDPPEYPDKDLNDGQAMTVGGLHFEVLHTPGHAPGHVIFVGEGTVLGGDLLFTGSIGRTDLPYCDPAAMERSLERIAGLEPGLVVHPGHGPSTTIGRELEMNPFLSGLARPLKR